MIIFNRDTLSKEGGVSRFVVGGEMDATNDTGGSAPGGCEHHDTTGTTRPPVPVSTFWHPALTRESNCIAELGERGM